MIARLPGGDWVTIGPKGHYRGTEGIENHLVYVAVTPEGAMTTLTPQQFAERYGWRNDPAKAYLAGE